MSSSSDDILKSKKKSVSKKESEDSKGKISFEESSSSEYDSSEKKKTPKPKKLTKKEQRALRKKEASPKKEDDEVIWGHNPLTEFAELDEMMAMEKFDNHKLVHVRVQKRTTKKSITTIQGLDPELDLKKILKNMRKVFCCNGHIIEDPEHGDVIGLQGDMRDNVIQMLLEEQLVEKDKLKVHGF